MHYGNLPRRCPSRSRGSSRAPRRSAPRNFLTWRWNTASTRLTPATATAKTFRAVRPVDQRPGRARSSRHPRQRRAPLRATHRVTPEDITSDLMTRWNGCRWTHVDLLVLHRDDPAVPVGPIVEILNEHQKAGKVGAFGGSNWTHARIQEANDYAQAHGLTPFAVSSPNFSLAEQVEEPWSNCISISGPQGEEARRFYAASDVALMPWSSLAGGFFSDRFHRDNLEEMAAGRRLRRTLHPLLLLRAELSAPGPGAGIGPGQRRHRRADRPGLRDEPADERLRPHLLRRPRPVRGQHRGAGPEADPTGDGVPRPEGGRAGVSSDASASVRDMP